MILDTNAVSALLVGDAVLGERLAGADRHHLPVVVIGEFRYGLARSRHRDSLEPLLDTLILESVVLPVDAETARVYAQVREELRAAGTPIPENDVWIAALSRQHGQGVVSADRHFDQVAGLDRVAW